MLIKRSPAFSKDFFTTRRPVRFDISSVSLHSDLFVLAARGLRRSCQPSAPINLRSSIMSDTIESTVMAEPEASSSSAILTGMKRGFPIFLGYVPLGFAYGVLAVQNNIPAVYAVLFSLLVYAGAGQFIAVGLWGMGASVFSIVFTTFVINLRHVLMSAAVAPWFAPFTRFQQFIIGWGLTDEVFAMHSMAMATGEKARLPLVYAANFTSHSGWVLGTFIGAVAGDFLPDPKLFGLDYALPAMVPRPARPPVQGTAVHAGGRPLGAAFGHPRHVRHGPLERHHRQRHHLHHRGPARHPPRPQHRRTQEESMNIDLLLCILGMALVTLIPRVMPVTLLAGRELPPAPDALALLRARFRARRAGRARSAARGRQAQHLRG